MHFYSQPDLRELPDGRIIPRADLEDMPISEFFEACDVTIEDLYYLCALERDDFIEDCTTNYSQE
ncbi:hypothetical protein FACS1894217_07810 [Clostridia bacterium]|nr:hypothetical protein FACS1894217_07810 [Clostridia bacterium]